MKKVIEVLTATPAAATPGTTRLAASTPQTALKTTNPIRLPMFAANRDTKRCFAAIVAQLSNLRIFVLRIRRRSTVS